MYSASHIDVTSGVHFTLECVACISYTPFGIIAEILGTYFLIFAGCGVVAVDLSKGGAVTFPGVSMETGANVHHSPASGLDTRQRNGAFVVRRRAQPLLRDNPDGSNVQSLVLEFIITFFLMFVLAGVATDNRAVSY
uniref:Uncharacterized protein n=1 Tax=Ananas comosus var. bracteatus TaxID=296719 RepID=A0A6V7QC43_ANACO|nr:unnamed protein product [Ananas comosus var. bracteatus]